MRISFVASLIFMDVSILSDDLDGNSDDLAVFFLVSLDGKMVMVILMGSFADQCFSLDSETNDC